MNKQNIETGIINLFSGNNQAIYQQIPFNQPIIYPQATITNDNFFSNYPGGFEKTFNDILCFDLYNNNNVNNSSYIAQDIPVKSRPYFHIDDKKNVFVPKKDILPDIVFYNHAQINHNVIPNFQGFQVSHALESGHNFIGQSNYLLLDKTLHELWKLKTAGIDKCFFVAIYPDKQNCQLDEVKNQQYLGWCNGNMNNIDNYRQAINCVDPNYLHLIFPTVRHSGHQTYIHVFIIELAIPAIDSDNEGQLKNTNTKGSYLAPIKVNGKWKIRVINDKNFDNLFRD